mmetsp:Transcript_4205/g.6037  ORF Transcript_4205/g.6037 Transcript_4205/m.6037 type:complete len:179 (-) Transcript_4205:1083-1619(-)
MINANTSSCFIMTAVGSLSDVTLRFAGTPNKNTKSKDEQDGIVRNDIVCGSSISDDDGYDSDASCHNIRHWKDERFEIVSLQGTFSMSSGFHLHMSISNAAGETFGGHVIAGTIFTTMEVVLGTIEGVKFDRAVDDETGYRELVVSKEENEENKEKKTSVAEKNREKIQIIDKLLNET